MGVIYIVHLTVFVCPEGKVFKENCFALKVEKKKSFPVFLSFFQALSYV